MTRLLPGTENNGYHFYFIHYPLSLFIKQQLSRTIIRGGKGEGRGGGEEEENEEEEEKKEEAHYTSKLWGTAMDIFLSSMWRFNGFINISKFINLYAVRMGS